MTVLGQKESGAYFTPEHVAESLVSWAVASQADRLLDPSCGDGRFISRHRNSFGVEQNPESARLASTNAPHARVQAGDFFDWASRTSERFECAAGNPPFIRYQTFKGETREQALSLCKRAGALFNGLASSWAPFLVATAHLLKPGGRIAFVVPAEIGHAPYAAPLLEYLLARFAVVHVVAVRNKLFPELSEDCWLLFADGFGSNSDNIRFTTLTAFAPMASPPTDYLDVSAEDWRTKWRRRLRPYLLSNEARALYEEAAYSSEGRRFGDVAQIGIGYVTGANDFFHLRPSDAERLGIPAAFLHPSVRNGRALPAQRLTASTIGDWQVRDEQVLLLNLPKRGALPSEVMRYLNSEGGHEARQAYKCRSREPWYSVPDVQYPDLFLTYMSGREPGLVSNDARATCTNSVHSVRLRAGVDPDDVMKAWDSPFVKLSCELEGHPLGGGMLKLEPREATQIVLPDEQSLNRLAGPAVQEALATMRQWRHHAPTH